MIRFVAMVLSCISRGEDERKEKIADSKFFSLVFTSTCVLFVMCVLYCSSGYADFLLNFDRSSFGGDASENENIGKVFQDDFIQDVVEIDGVSYFRTVVGRPEDGFAMETYTPGAISAWCGPENILATPKCVSWGLYSGGLERAVIGGGTDVNADWRLQPNDPLGLTYDKTLFPGANKWDISGTGTHDPTKVVFRMVLDDGGVHLEVFKPFLDRKPLILQTVVDTHLRSQFVMDARSITYDDKDTPAVLLNRMVMTDPETNAMNPGAANFDMSKIKNSTFSGGQYTYQAGGGWDDDVYSGSLGWDTPGSTYDDGTYDYKGAEFNPLDHDWGQYFDSEVNCVNPDKWYNTYTPEYGCN